MTREEQALERLRAANPLPDLDRIDPDEMTAIFSLLDTRRSAVKTAVKKQVPVRESTREAEARRRRAAFVFAVAAISVLIILGIGFLFVRGDGGNDVISPSDTTPTETSAPSETTPVAVAKGSADPYRYQRLVNAELVGGVSAGGLPKWLLKDIVTGVPGCTVNSALERFVTEEGTESEPGEADFVRARVAMVVARCPAIDPVALAEIAPGVTPAEVEEMLEVAAG